MRTFNAECSQNEPVHYCLVVRLFDTGEDLPTHLHPNAPVSACSAIQKMENEVSAHFYEVTVEKSRAVGNPRLTLYLLHALSGAADTVQARRGTRSSPRPTDMASSLPIGAPNPPAPTRRVVGQAREIPRGALGLGERDPESFRAVHRALVHRRSDVPEARETDEHRHAKARQQRRVRSRRLGPRRPPVVRGRPGRVLQKVHPRRRRRDDRRQARLRPVRVRPRAPRVFPRVERILVLPPGRLRAGRRREKRRRDETRAVETGGRPSSREEARGSLFEG